MTVRAYKNPKCEDREGYINTHSVVVNPRDNGGEAITLSLDVFSNGDPPPKNIFHNLCIDLQCYGSHSTTIDIGGYGTAFRDALNMLLESVEKQTN